MKKTRFAGNMTQRPLTPTTPSPNSSPPHTELLALLWRVTHPHDTIPKLISTDPPYYDAVPYADLSDFFYVWLRRSLGSVYPTIFNTVLVPKAQEMVADHFRHGTKSKAKDFFEASLTKVFHRANQLSHHHYPVTVYYALKQTETDESDQVASTGWETILEGLIQSNFSIDGTWPLRTELANRMRGQASNALASSIVLVCRPRPADAPKATRRQFLTELKQELPKALHTLQQGSIAPVDLAQASIDPGMAIYSRYAAVLENDGSPLDHPHRPATDQPIPRRIPQRARGRIRQRHPLGHHLVSATPV